MPWWSLLPLVLATEPPAASAPPSAPADVPLPVQATPTTWPTWRGGPTQQGVSPGTLRPDDLAPRWTRSLGKPIQASAVVDEDRLYLGDGEGVLHALDRHTGATRWTHQADGPIEAPAVRVADLVIVGATDGHLRALHAATGALRWSVDLGERITGAASPVAAQGDTPPSLLIGAHDGRLHRLRLSDGEPLWTYTTGSYLYGSAAVDEGKVVMGGCDGHVHVVDLATGKGQHRIPVEGYVGGSAMLDAHGAVVGHFGNQVLAFSPATGAPQWTHQDLSFPYLSSPARLGEHVILGGRDRQLHALDRATGQPVWWVSAKGKVDSSPVVVGDHVVVGSHDGRLRIVRPDGEVARALDLGAPISASVATASGWLWIGTEDGTLHAWGPPPPSADSPDTDER